MGGLNALVPSRATREGCIEDSRAEVEGDGDFGGGSIGVDLVKLDSEWSKLVGLGGRVGDDNDKVASKRGSRVGFICDGPTTLSLRPC